MESRFWEMLDIGIEFGVLSEFNHGLEWSMGLFIGVTVSWTQARRRRTCTIVPLPINILVVI